MALLGDRLRELRITRNLTLKEVADATSLSISFLSLVERDKVSISVDNLERLAHYYGVRLVHLFQGVEDSAVLVTRYQDVERKISQINDPRSAFMLLSYRNGARMEPLIIKIGPGHSDSQFRTQEGDTFLYVLEGKINLISEKGDTDQLVSGDSAYYFGFPGRRIENASLKETALILLITAPPAALRDDALDGRNGVILELSQE
jgi:transcriptional regulator with XRE-family HTH domain